MVTLFGSPNFDVGLARVFAPGSYNHDQLSYSTLYTMPVQSLIVPSGLSLVLFKDFYLESESKTIMGPAKIDLKSNPDFKDWNMQINSI